MLLEKLHVIQKCVCLVHLHCRKKRLSFKMQTLHHKTQRVIYNSNKNLRNCDNNLSLHQVNLRILVTWILKSVSKTNLKFMWSYFRGKKLPQNIRKRPPLLLPSKMSTMYGKNSVYFKDTLIWNNLTYFVKSSAAVYKFKIWSSKLKT